MDGQQDEYFDEETGEVMSPKENNMAAIDQDSADERNAKQNSVDKNGNNADNAVVKTSTEDKDKSVVSLDLNVNNIDVVNSKKLADLVTESDTQSPKSIEEKSSPVDTGGSVRHFRVTKSSHSTGGSADNLKPRVSFVQAVSVKDEQFSKSAEVHAEPDREVANNEMDVDRSAGGEQTTPRSPNVIHVSDPDYSEDVLIQFGVDPLKWMYPKDLSRLEKPQSPVPTHNDNDLTDSELLTQFCSGKGTVYNNSQAKPRRGTSTGAIDHTAADTGGATDPTGAGFQRPNLDPGHSQPRKVIITETERFRVPPNLKKTGDNGKGSETNKCEVPTNRDINNLPGRRTGMIRMESGESETGESKGRRNLEEVGLNTNSTSGAAGWNWGKEDIEQQYSDYVKNMNDSRDVNIQTDDIPAEENTKCMCPQCGHEMKVDEARDKGPTPTDIQLAQDKENVCHCDHSDKGPDWHAMFMFKWFKMHSFMMNRCSYRFPSHSPNQGEQRPPCPPPPWVRPWMCRPSGPTSQVNQAGPCGPTAAGPGQGPWQRFRAPWWCKPPASPGDCPHGADKPNDVPKTGAC